MRPRDDVVRADVVVIAEGTNRLVLERSFEDERTAWMFVGFPTGYLPGASYAQTGIMCR